MKLVSTRIVVMLLMLLMLPMAIDAQNIIGSWQGTLHAGPQPLRIIVRVTKGTGGRLTAALWSIDEGAGFDRSYPADTVQRTGSNVKVTWTEFRVRYVGTLDSRLETIHGTWTEEGTSQPLDLARADKRAQWRDESAHTVRLVRIERDVRLEALDWGGKGRPIVLLAGNGNTAHVFDQIAPKLTGEYHVYGITRRGFGRSSAPKSGYLADSLADDVLAVLDSLGVRRPILIGHSLAGQELSSIGSRHPEKVAGLVYLDAGYQYAFSDSNLNNPEINIGDAQRKLVRLVDPAVAMTIRERGAMIAELLQTSLPRMERDLRAWQGLLASRPNQSAIAPAADSDPVSRAIAMGHQRYTGILAPTLAIFALPREYPPDMSDTASRARWDSLNQANLGPQINAFERGVQSVRVVRLPHANHYVFRSNETDVLREIRAFIAGLPPAQ